MPLRHASILAYTMLALAPVATAQCGDEQPGRITGPVRWMVGGEHLWISSDSAGIRQFEIDAADQPVEIGWIPTNAPPLGCLEVGDTLYVATSRTLKVLDLANGSREVAEIDFGPSFRTHPTGLVTNGTLLAVPTFQALRLYDIRDPHNPVAAGEITGDMSTFSLSGDHLAVSSNFGNLIDLYDVANAPTLTQIGRMRLPSQAIVLENDMLTVISSDIRVYDISDPDAPVRIANTPTYQPPMGTFRMSRSGTGFAVGRSSYAFDEQNVPLTTRYAPLAPSLHAAHLPRHAAFSNGTVTEIYRHQKPRPPVLRRVHVRTPQFIGWSAVAEVEILPEPGVTYQWYSAGTPIPGATSPRFVGPPIRSYLMGYTCRIINGCGETWATAAFIGGCSRDYNRDGVRDADDLEAFIADFQTGNPLADVNGDEFIDFFDYDQFLDAFFRC